MSDRSPLSLVATSFSMASLAGLAELLRRGEPLTWQRIVAVMLWSGLLGVLAMLALMALVSRSQAMLLFIATLTGGGAASLFDLASAAFNRWVLPKK